METAAQILQIYLDLLVTEISLQLFKHVNIEEHVQLHLMC